MTDKLPRIGARYKRKLCPKILITIAGNFRNHIIAVDDRDIKLYEESPHIGDYLMKITFSELLNKFEELPEEAISKCEKPEQKLPEVGSKWLRIGEAGEVEVVEVRYTKRSGYFVFFNSEDEPHKETLHDFLRDFEPMEDHKEEEKPKIEPEQFYKKYSKEFCDKSFEDLEKAGAFKSAVDKALEELKKEIDPIDLMDDPNYLSRKRSWFRDEIIVLRRKARNLVNALEEERKNKLPINITGELSIGNIGEPSNLTRDMNNDTVVNADDLTPVSGISDYTRDLGKLKEIFLKNFKQNHQKTDAERAELEGRVKKIEKTIYE